MCFIVDLRKFHLRYYQDSSDNIVHHFMDSYLVKLQNYAKLQTAWRKTLQKVWKLPSQTHCELLHCLNYQKCEKHVLYECFVKFAHLNLNHSQEIIRYIFIISLKYQMSVFSTNIKHICDNVGMQFINNGEKDSFIAH